MTLHDGFNLWMGKTLAELAITGILLVAFVLGVVIYVGVGMAQFYLKERRIARNRARRMS